IAASDADRFLEIGPDGTLSALVDGIPTLRKDQDEETALLTALARLHVTGTTVDWQPLFAGTGAQRADIPTYAFDQQWYWPSSTGPARDVRSAGLGATGHPLLGTAVPLAGGTEIVFSTRVSRISHPWLGDHVIGGQALVPGAALLDLAIRAGDEIGYDHIEHLTLAAPLVIPERGGVHIQVRIGAPDESDLRPITVHSRDEAAGDLPWSTNATGNVANRVGPERPVERPVTAEPIPVDHAYEGLAEVGFGYGPTFRALRGAWKTGDDVFAEVALPERVTDASRFGLHPVLLDAGLHAVMLAGNENGAGGAELPFEWRGVTLHATGVETATIRLSRGPDGLAIDVVDDSGAPILTVDTLAVRPAELAETPSEPGHDELFTVDWTPIDATGEPTPVSLLGADPFDLNGHWQAAGLANEPLSELTEAADAATVVVQLGNHPDVITAGHRAATRAMELVQNWLNQNRSGQLVFITRGVLAGADVGSAAAWGLVRTAQTEHPGRFRLLDIGLDIESAETAQLIGRALATDEPELAATATGISVPRLARLANPSQQDGTNTQPQWDPDGTVVITGGTGGLGALLADHLARNHAVRHLLLLSRRGPAAAGDMVERLAAHGATATVAACDVTDRGALAEALASVPREHPVTAIVHTAGVLDDGVVESLTPDRLASVLAPKLDATWHLHELTADHDLTAFIVFSSAAGTFGGAGQANYAAANTSIDALIAHRRAAGLPGISMAWGPWDQQAGMTGGLTEAESRRLARSGMPPVTPSMGLALFDAAVTADAAHQLPIRLDLATLRRQEAVPPLLRGLIRTPRRAAAGNTPDPAALGNRLAELGSTERIDLLLDLVRREAAAVLGHPGTVEIEPARQFRDLGFDSLTAVELRNRLGAVTGLPLPATMVFDYPTPSELVEHLAGELTPEDQAPEATLLACMDALERAFGAVTVDDQLHRHVTGRLEVLRTRWVAGSDTEQHAAHDDLDNVSDDEMFAYLDHELDMS
ncbi:phosphopantetheine binding protein, partial [Tamaricihabitans halophyticus]